VKRACKGVFVAGTDTEVGKSFVSAALVAALRARGMDVGYCKPISTDGVPGKDGLVSPDAIWVAGAAGLREPPQSMNPFCLAHALSPLAAARLEGVDLDWQELLAKIRASLQGHDSFICEGVGGVLVPLLPGHTTLDLMTELSLGVVIAARPGLGTINHTLLTIQSVRKRFLRVLGFVFSGPEENQEQGDRRALNSQLIVEFSGIPFLGALPFIENPNSAELKGAVDKHLKLEAILKACA
jgi:dethiobiotin synthetase